MSFGWSAGDILAGIQLANVLRKRYRDAPSQLRLLNTELENISVALQDAAVSWDEDDLGSARKLQLENLTRNSTQVLKAIESTVDKYVEIGNPALGTVGKVKHIWKRLNLEPKEIQDLRFRVVSHVVALNAFHSTTLKTDMVAIKLDTGTTKDIAEAILADTSQLKEGTASLQQQLSHTIGYRDSEEMEDLLHWISPVNFGIQLDNASRRCQDGTCQWFFNDTIYKDWTEGKHKTLFCHGMPGAGKTTLTAAVIDRMLSGRTPGSSVGLAYLFCESKQKDTQTIEYTLSLLLKQLVTQLRSLPSDLTKMYHEYKRRSKALTRTDINNFLEIVCKCFEAVYLFVDALDECDNADHSRFRMVQDLFALQQNSNVRLLFTSRNAAEISFLFINSAKIEIYAHVEDILLFLEQSIKDIPGLAQRLGELQKIVIPAITIAAAGMFLLAKLYLDSVATKRTVKGVKTLLGEMLKTRPPERNAKMSESSHVYDHAYDQVMERIRTQPPESRIIAEKMLIWLTFGKDVWFLSSQDIAQLIAIEEGASAIDSENVPQADDIIDVCAGLVVFSSETSKFRFVHYTVQEYFERNGLIQLPQPYSYLNRTCMAYLMCSNLRDMAKTMLVSDLAKSRFPKLSGPLTRYALRYWNKYAQKADLDVEFTQTFLKDRFAVCLVLLYWLWQDGFDEYVFAITARQDCTIEQAMKSTSLSYLAATFCICFGLKQHVMGFLSRCDVKTENFLGLSILYFALARDDKGIVELVLQFQENVQQTRSLRKNLDPHFGPDRSKYDAAILREAIRRSSPSIVEILLQSGLRDCSTELLQSPQSDSLLKILQELSHRGDDDIGFPNNLSGSIDFFTEMGSRIEKGLELLRPRPSNFEKGRITNSLIIASLEPREWSGTSALHVAIACRRPLRTIKLLLQYHSAPNIRDFFGNTPLHIAIASGDIKLVECLLASGADPNSRDNMGCSVLHKAIQLERPHIPLNSRMTGFENEPVLRDLLDGSLSTAERSDYIQQIVKLFLKAGANVNQQTYLNDFPLFAAVQSSNLALVRLLTEHKADVRVRYYDGRFAVEVAWEQGMDDIAKHLGDLMSRTPLGEVSSPLHDATINVPVYLSHETSQGGRAKLDFSLLSRYWTHESIDSMTSYVRKNLQEKFGVYYYFEYCPKKYPGRMTWTPMSPENIRRGWYDSLLGPNKWKALSEHERTEPRYLGGI